VSKPYLFWPLGLAFERKAYDMKVARGS